VRDISAHTKAPSKEIYSKSMICDFLLTTNSNRDRITYGLRNIIAYRGWKSQFLRNVFQLPTPSKGMPSNINVICTLLKSTFSVLQLLLTVWVSSFV